MAYSTSLLAPLFSSAAMRALLDDRVRLQRMLDVEAALARAESALGIIPASAARTIAEACKADHFDLASIAAAGPASGNIAIPLVQALTAQVKKADPVAAGYVHWGATSQDIIDTALVLDLRAGIDALIADLDRAIAGFASLAEQNRRTASLARTWLQQALPMPFGLKLAGYAAALARARARLVRVRGEALVLQFGGAVGTLAALGARGLEVADALAAALNLPLPDAPWHSHRDRLAEIAAALAILAGSCGKIARDVSLLMQNEVAEAFEPPAAGKGGSSTMPHKRNPVGSSAALAAATMAPQLAATIFAAQVQEHERAAGSWPAEWMTFPALLLVTSGALAAVADMAEGLQIDPVRMRANLDATRGQIMAEAVSFRLAEKFGKAEAHKMLEQAGRKARSEGRDLKSVLAADKTIAAHVPAGELDALFDPMQYQGVAQGLIDRLLAAARKTGA
ncbi:MAG TPA: 3-carboxy-cis,cis-muconate cycloisomerase [Pseudorhodoplanes sp.]|jgi:3-carboxy-cis,cis-muconate cycloisomerase|nr:3-carboxy-cis,cis-muconate cycloisomerase [Pseudorhodoplanes sp.]